MTCNHPRCESEALNGFGGYCAAHEGSDKTRQIIEAHAEVVLETESASHEEWLEMRKTGIGGSDSASALGLNPYRGRYSLYAQKTSEFVDDEDNERMYWGRKLEVPILEAFEERTLTPVQRYPRMLRSRKYPWMTVNLDGYTDGAVVEAKNVGARMVHEWEDDRGGPAVPDHYSLQGQHACVVTGLPGVWFVVLIGGQELRWIYVERDDALCEVLIEALRKFWDLIQNRTPPPVDGSASTTKALKQQFSDAIAASTDVDPVMVNWLVRRAQLKAQARDLKAEIEGYDNSIRAALGNYEVGEVNGEVVVTWKSQIRKSYTVEAGSFRKLHVPKSKTLELASAQALAELTKGIE